MATKTIAISRPPNSVSRLTLSSTVQNISNYFKPHRAEALQRIRLNSFILIVVLILSNLLPFPSVQAAVKAVATTNHHETWSSEWVYLWICRLEVAIVTVLGYNVLEGVYAVKYPRAPLPPLPSPEKPKSLLKSAPTPQRPFKVLSPHSSPQVQRPFALSSSSSFSSSNFGSTMTYPTSPVSTPSRVLQYSVPPSASSSSTMAFSPTPSPIVSAYRAKHASSVGHALDGSFLNRFALDVSDDEEEE